MRSACRSTLRPARQRPAWIPSRRVRFASVAQLGTTGAPVRSNGLRPVGPDARGLGQRPLAPVAARRPAQRRLRADAPRRRTSSGSNVSASKNPLRRRTRSARRCAQAATVDAPSKPTRSAPPLFIDETCARPAWPHARPDARRRTPRRQGTPFEQNRSAAWRRCVMTGRRAHPVRRTDQRKPVCAAVSRRRSSRRRRRATSQSSTTSAAARGTGRAAIRKAGARLAFLPVADLDPIRTGQAQDPAARTAARTEPAILDTPAQSTGSAGTSMARRRPLPAISRIFDPAER